MFYISLIPFIVLLIYDLKKSLHMAQQNLYNDDHRFLKWTLKDIKSFKTPLKCSLVVLITYLILLVFKLEASVITSIYFFVVCLIILLIEIKENKNADTKIKWKVTARVKRLIFTNVVLFALLCVGLYFVKNVNIIYLCLFLYDMILNFVIMISIIINKPAEKMVYLSYKTKAVNKLKAMNSLKVIGITGSYGKTSSKNILSDILNVKYNALPSPRNFNTPYGLIITVNNT